MRILIISDLETDRDLILGQLDNQGLHLQTEQVCSVLDFQQKIDQSWNLILFMSHISFLFPLDVLQYLKSNHPHLPLILLSNGMSEEEVAFIIKSGAEDVVISSRMQRLGSVVKRIIKDVDVNERERHASKIAHEALATREQMLAIVSHDIKNPLSAISLEAQMMLRVAERHGELLMPPEIKKQAERILKTTDRLKLLINDLLDKNKTEDGLSKLSITDCDVTKLFQEVFNSHRSLLKQKNLVIRTSFKPGIILPVDKNKIYQALSNLVGNAIKFTPEWGSIELKIDELDDRIICSVSDSGPGIATKDIKNIFEKYWTTGFCKRTGTGLGLFICKTIINAHHGQIGGENLESGGARFWFTLPMPSLDTPVGFIKDEKAKILVIDDDDDLRELISWALAGEGYAVHSYADPTEALESLQLGRHIPQLIVVDFQMEQMLGTEFLRQMKMNSLPHVKTCPAIIISATPQDIDHVEAKFLCDEIMTKPFDLASLITSINGYLT